MTPDELGALLVVARQHGVTSLLIQASGGECLKVDLAPVATTPVQAAPPAAPPTMGELMDHYGEGIPTDV